MSSTPSGIYAGVLLCGLGFGTVWPLMVVVAGDLFGTEHLGANYNFYDGFSSACGSVAFALLLPSFAYDPRVDENGYKKWNNGHNGVFFSISFPFSFFMFRS